MNQKLDESIPYGYCHCGCGRKTSISKRTYGNRGYKKDEPVPYLPGHHGSRKRKPHNKPNLSEYAKNRPPEHKEKLRQTRIRNGYTKQLGARFIDKKGYVWIKVAESGPYAVQWKLEHRLVVEQYIGRPLSKKEHIHHIDANPANNELSNLVILSQLEHYDLNGVLRVIKKDQEKLALIIMATLKAQFPHIFDNSKQPQLLLDL